MITVWNKRQGCAMPGYVTGYEAPEEIEYQPRMEAGEEPDSDSEPRYYESEEELRRAASVNVHLRNFFLFDCEEEPAQ